MGADNHKLGKFEITGIAPARAGIPQIEVTFEVDNNGVLHVSAKDMARGKTESITINNDQNRCGTLSYYLVDRLQHTNVKINTRYAQGLRTQPTTGNFSLPVTSS